MKILLCKVDMRNKLYEMNFFELCSKKEELMKQIHLFKKGFLIFLKGATFSDFIETSLSNYKPLAIGICFPLFWRIFFQLCSNLIKQCGYQVACVVGKLTANGYTRGCGGCYAKISATEPVNAHSHSRNCGNGGRLAGGNLKKLF